RIQFQESGSAGTGAYPSQPGWAQQRAAGISRRLDSEFCSGRSAFRALPAGPGRPAVTPAGAAGQGRHPGRAGQGIRSRSEEHTSELQSRENLVCRLLLEKKKKKKMTTTEGERKDAHR